METSPKAWLRYLGKGLLFTGYLLVRLLQTLLRYSGQALNWVYTRRLELLHHRWALTLVVVGYVGYTWWQFHSAQVASPAPTENAPTSFRLVSYGNFEKQYQELVGRLPGADANPALTQAIYPWLGTPHVDGGNSRQGIDCSGFVHAVYREAYGLELERSSGKMHEVNTVPIDTASLSEGDLVFFAADGSRISHVGIYLADGKFAHTSSSRGVTVNSLSEKYYQQIFYAAGRVPRSQP